MDTIRHNVAIALGNSGDQSAVAPLIEALSEKRTKIRVAVAWALGILGGEMALEALRKALVKEKNSLVKKEINEALHKISEKLHKGR